MKNEPGSQCVNLLKLIKFSQNINENYSNFYISVDKEA